MVKTKWCAVGLLTWVTAAAGCAGGDVTCLGLDTDDPSCAEGVEAADPSVPLEERIGAIQSELSLGSRGPGVRAVQDYLARFGYLPNDALAEQYPDWRPFVADTPAAGLYDSVTARAVQEYQRFMGLEQTGRVNEEALQAMRAPRCGVPDSPDYAWHTGGTVEKFYLNVDSNGVPIAPFTRGVGVSFKIADAVSGTTYPKLDPAYSPQLNGPPESWDYYNDLLRDVTLEALNIWHAATNIDFVESDAANANIQLRWDNREGLGATGAGNGYAKSIKISTQLIDFQTQTNTLVWYRGAGAPPIGSSRYDLRTTVLHELGHAIGLPHSSVGDADLVTEQGIDSVMLPTQSSGRRNFDLHVDDRVAVSALYDTWLHVDGKATDIDVGAADNPWILGSSGSTTGERIYRWNGSGWVFTKNDAGQSDERYAVRIAVDMSGFPWIIGPGSTGRVYRRTTYTPDSGSWVAVGGNQCAKDIDVGWDGSVWIVDCTDQLRKLSLSAYSADFTGATWSAPAGSGAARLAVDSLGIPWTVQTDHTIRRRTTNDPATGTWQNLPGTARDITAGPAYQSFDYQRDANGRLTGANPPLPVRYVFITDNSSLNGGGRICLWNEQLGIAGSSANNATGNSGSWVRVDGIAEMITVNYFGTPWAVNTYKDIFKRDK